ncbi:unnamed protein product [Ectocarpus sp. CCAP 1310/34]|nr:unnamed protein product [Ectocarpus sp. CCAP 1310/34]
MIPAGRRLVRQWHQVRCGRAFCSATRPSRVWMRQEEELRALQQGRDEELKEQQRERERVLTLPYTGVKEEKTAESPPEVADAKSDNEEDQPTATGDSGGG